MPQHASKDNKYVFIGIGVLRDATMDEISRMYAKHMGLGPAEKVGAPVEPAASAAGAASPAFGDVVEPTVEVHCDGGAGEVTLYKRGFRQGVSLDHAYRPAGEDAKP